MGAKKGGSRATWGAGGGSARERSKSNSKSGSTRSSSSSSRSKQIKADGSEKATWYQDKKVARPTGPQPLDALFPCTASHWVLDKFKSAKGHSFLCIAHTSGVQVALKERNAGEFYWRSPLEPKVRRGQPPGGVQIQPSGHRTMCPRDMLPDVHEFDEIVKSAKASLPATRDSGAVVSGGVGADGVTTLDVGRYRYGRYGYWEVILSQNGTVTVTNSNKGTKGTQYAISFARFGALTFTDVDGGGHMLADQDELDQQRKMVAKALDSEKARSIRVNRKKAEAAKKVSKKKLPRAGKRTGLGSNVGGGRGEGEDGDDSADGDDDSDDEEWTCYVCNTQGNHGKECSTCRRERGHDDIVGRQTAMRSVEEAELKRRLGTTGSLNELAAMRGMAEKPLKSEVKRRAKAASRMIGRKKDFNTVDVLLQIQLAKQGEAMLEKLIVAREIIEANMGFVAFVKSAKRFKRERKKPRKRKLEAKIAKMSRKFENVRLWRAEEARAKEAGELKQHPLLRAIRFALVIGTFGCVTCCWKKYDAKVVAKKRRDEAKRMYEDEKLKGL